jgi:hypothetical protein
MSRNFQSTRLSPIPAHLLLVATPSVNCTGASPPRQLMRRMTITLRERCSNERILAMMGLLRRLWWRLLEFDGRIHAILLVRYPSALPAFDGWLLWIVDKFISSPVFGVLLALVLGVLALIGVHKLILACVLGAWIIAFLWIARADGLRKLTVGARALALLLIGTLLALGAQRFASWANRQHEEEARQKQVDDRGPVPPTNQNPIPNQKSMQPAPGVPPLKTGGATSLSRSWPSHKTTKTPDQEKDSDVFQMERPELVVIMTTLNAPVLPLNNVIRHAGFQIAVENRGRHFAQHAALSGRMIFPNPGINLKAEIEAECRHPSLYMLKEGTSIGPGEQRRISATADTDFDGLSSQLHEPKGSSLWGFMVGCVVYHSELSKRILHTGFSFAISSSLSLAELKDLLDRGLPPPDGKVSFSPQEVAFDD